MSPFRAAWGSCLLEDGQVRFRLWAPSQQRVCVRLFDPDATLEMACTDGGWHELTTRRAAAGSTYGFVLQDGSTVADPASAFQPAGAAGRSEVIDFDRYQWASAAWRGRPWQQCVLYELHVGAFTPEGTFRAAIGKLPHLVALGITAIQLMPVAAFEGGHNWGYDGVSPYAPDASYGRPEDLQAFIDAAHVAGLMVLLDVVYNHFGPEGNAMHHCAPEFFTARHATPWGASFSFEGETAVRQFFIENALHWLQHYQLDGLRLDAVHAILDDTQPHVIDELATAVRQRFTQREVHLVLENEHNESHRLARRDGKPVLFTAQWNDDIHHVLHTAATGEASGYYADYVGDPGKLARAVAEGFCYQGEYMNYRGAARGEPSGSLPPVAFISFIQNHDQVGNRAFGDRLAATAPPDALRAVAALYLLAPQIPMLFMGEEWAAAQPFPFFCDFHGELGEAVTKGRRDEFARFPEFSDPAQRERIPDPTGAATFASAKLRWDDLAKPPHHAMLAWYSAILSVRRQHIVPLLSGIVHGGEHQVLPSGAIQVRWRADRQGWLLLHANLQAAPALVGPAPAGQVLWQEGQWSEQTLQAWSLTWMRVDS
ncbi:MAG: malto-oligosyltrehalose trehalohydrolase [Steroidobacteraceae bacterium]